jgi:hypothetical protein
MDTCSYLKMFLVQRVKNENEHTNYLERKLVKAEMSFRNKYVRRKGHLNRSVHNILQVYLDL